MEKKKSKTKKKIVEINERLSDIIHDFFNGSVISIGDNLKSIYNDPNKNVNFKRISESDMKELKKISKVSKKADYKLVLKDRSDKVYDAVIEPVKSIEEDTSKDASKDKITLTKDNRYIDIHKKAFINWINNEFIVNIDKDDQFKPYQSFIKNYMSLKSPYRGVLVYHGLGTGKTATAVITTEGLSQNMDINTLLPASLESEFIKEIKKWGDNNFKLDKNNWKFITYEEYLDNNDLINEYSDKYKFNLDVMNLIYNKVKLKTKSSSFTKGVWITVDKQMSGIKSVSGKFIKKGIISSDKVDVLSEIEIAYIETQINSLIINKYGFIHYNPFPNVKYSNTSDFLKSKLEEPEKKENKTHNQLLVEKLYNKLAYNQANYNINSPFYNEVIIIDEVHNLVREIINDSKLALIFYNWIINAKNIKLICLSGTPIINKPSEICILFNMIRGNIRMYNFLIKPMGNINDIDIKLKEEFYTEGSPINQYNLTKKGGNYLLSITQNHLAFESIMDPNTNIIYSIKNKAYTFDEFLQYIYGILLSIIDESNIQPSYKDINDLSKKDIDLIDKGKPYTVSLKQIKKGNTEEIFNNDQLLFDININDKSMDLSDNNTFMDYFIDNNTITPKKKSLLKRMIQGLVSYYPIDRSAIATMPEIIKPDNIIYNDYNISDNIQVVPCIMSSLQFDKYDFYWKQSKIKSTKFNKKNVYSDDTFDYYIRNRQACNIVYNNDKFRFIKKNTPEYDKAKEEQYNQLISNNSLVGELLNNYSPKFYNVIKNISKFIKDDTPIGKILFYSEFRGDSGSEIFEQILIEHGYTKFNHLDKNKDKAKRYTFITGRQEDKQFQKINKDEYNSDKNKYGEYIQIMIISESGAEGISLSCVRQVHIMEPYWNYIRINQVFGRASRLYSHIGSEERHKKNPLLPVKERNVEQYIYLSVYPYGETIESIYNSLKELNNWNNIPDLDTSEDISNQLMTHHKDLLNIIQQILTIKTDTKNMTVDERLYSIMERKYNISNKITDIVKEASIDCIKNTTDDYKINMNCIRYDPIVQDEDSYFPTISADKLYEIDKKQYKSKISYFIKPDIYILLATENDIDIYVYYKLASIKDKNDVRYIKENGIILGYIDTTTYLYYSFTDSTHQLNKKLGNKFSVYQELYTLPNFMIISIIKNNIFPDISDIMVDTNLIGYKIKYNINGKSFFHFDYNFQIKLYDFEILSELNFDPSDIKPIILYNNELYKI